MGTCVGKKTIFNSIFSLNDSKTETVHTWYRIVILFHYMPCILAPGMYSSSVWAEVYLSVFCKWSFVITRHSFCFPLEANEAQDKAAARLSGKTPSFIPFQTCCWTVVSPSWWLFLLLEMVFNRCLPPAILFPKPSESSRIGILICSYVFFPRFQFLAVNYVAASME